ncbi:hypothetical protein GCM10027036_18220 [Flavihumibacter cheonanensis]|uniref:hypothetical protein n=1 Tax=Flavihumibacter cheonanensis TaxID=1442385 RepID=UPI001EF99F29|nr:hypothetical protein [Flavihumibacter cheonanensis]MCG7750738.1 hypothetical protein [Flavihumibacter cheonanensis]
MKPFISLLLLAAGSFIMSCNDAPKEQTHTHEDGSTHADHATDTTKPVQQEFTLTDSTKTDSLKTDTSGKAHTHADGKEHVH